MPPELPIACSLDNAELPGRVADMTAIGNASLLTVETTDARAVLRFRAEARERLAAIVVAESECCAFLAMELNDEPGAVRLTIEAPAGAEPVLHDLVAAFSGGRQAA